MRSRSSRQSPGVAATRVVLASVFMVMGAYRLFAAFQGAPTAGSTLVFSGLELLLGALIAGGWALRWTAMVAALALLLDAVLSYQFWNAAGATQEMQLLHFMKNTSLAAGMLLLALTSGYKLRY